jgi:hypothetical protein
MQACNLNLKNIFHGPDKACGVFLPSSALHGELAYLIAYNYVQQWVGNTKKYIPVRAVHARSA